MTFSDDVLMAYVDNELDEKTRIAVEAAVTADPEVACRIAQHQALRKRLASAFDPVLHEPVPDRLIDAVRNTAKVSGAQEGSNVIPLRPRVAPRSPLFRWAALAASLVVGFLAGWLVFRAGGPGPVVTRNGHMLARGPLARALTHQLVARQQAGQTVRIGVSFRSKTGEYCRTFSMRAPAVAGMACHAADGWRLQVLTGAEKEGAAGGGYRQAHSSMPLAVVVAVSNEISGEPLDARAEAAARRQGWKR